MRAHRRWHLRIWVVLPFIILGIMLAGLAVHSAKNPIKTGFQILTKGP
jgi:hypothetical protein